MRDFRDRTVVITGAAGGLGTALCQRFATAGARIGALDVSGEGLERLRRSWTGGEGGLLAVAGDLTDEKASRRAIEELREQLGPIYCLINNAGVTHLKNFAADQVSAVRRVMAVNFDGAVHATAAAFDDVRAEGGLIIAISSVAGYAPVLGRTAYCASKHALHGFFGTLRCELRNTEAGVLIVCPSFIATGIRARYEADEVTASGGTETGARAGTPGRTVGQEDSPEQVAELIFEAARRDRRLLTTGRVGKLAWWGQKLAPRFYERMMLRSIRDE